MHSFGFLYIATGEKYLKEAIFSAQSLKVCMPNARICLLSDSYITDKCFDEILVIKDAPQVNWKSGLLSKVQGFLLSPFDKTVFVDTDTYFCEPVDELEGLLDHFDCLFCHDYYDKAAILFEGKEVLGFFPVNTGVVAYRRNDKVRAFLNLWIAKYKENIERYWSDQPAFMEALLSSDIKTWILHSGYNFRFLNHVSLPDQEKVRILHGRAKKEEFYLLRDRINKSISQRGWDADSRSVYSWTRKSSAKIMMEYIYQFVPVFLKNWYRKNRN